MLLINLILLLLLLFDIVVVVVVVVVIVVVVVVVFVVVVVLILPMGVLFLLCDGISYEVKSATSRCPSKSLRERNWRCDNVTICINMPTSSEYCVDAVLQQVLCKKTRISSSDLFRFGQFNVFPKLKFSNFTTRQWGHTGHTHLPHLRWESVVYAFDIAAGSSGNHNE